MTSTPGGVDHLREQKLNKIVEEVFSLPEEEQRAFLEEACSGDESLLQEASAYLMHEDDLGGFLEEPAAVAVGTGEIRIPTTVSWDAPTETPVTMAESKPRSRSDDPKGDHDVLLGTKIRQFRFLRVLGEGGMGKLYVGFDENLRREVAIKTIRGRQWRKSRKRALFLREARILSQLEHPNICRIYEYIEGETNDFLVLELIRGKTLAQVLREDLEEAQKLRIAEQIAEALMAAHSQSVIHCDLKPMNIMLTDGGQAKVLDFGIARTLGWRASRVEESGKKLAGMTSGVFDAMEGKVLGTPGYMSPEQTRGEEVTAPTDIYALSLVLQELFTGRPAYDKHLSLETLGSRMAVGQTAPLRGLVPELTTLLEHMRAFSPSDRPTASEVAGRLQWLTAVHSVGFSESGVISNPLQPLETGAAQEEGWLQAPAPGEKRGERRLVTVVSVELIASRGNPPDSQPVGESLEEFKELALEIAKRWEGHLERVAESRLVLCFGYPSSREGEARRAVLAALELSEGVAQMAEGMADGPALLIGLHTGLGVVSSVGGEERLRLGPTRALADTVCRKAAPGEVMLTDATHRLVDRSFRFREVPSPEFAENEQVKTIYQVLEARDGPADDVFEMVSRREELDLLLGRWRLAQQGEGQGVLLIGAAGIGKSRLVREFVGQVAAGGAQIWSFHGSPEARSSPLQPVFQPLRQALGLDSHGDGQSDLGQIETVLRGLELEPSEVLPYLAPILSLVLDERYQVPDLGPQRLKRKIQESLLSVFLGSAVESPRVLLVEDLHWLDPSTLELLGLLLEEVESTPLLMVLTTRPEFEIPWTRQAALFTQILLKPLTAEETRVLVEGIVGSHSVEQGVHRLIAERTDGVPLFIEELTRDLVESEKLVERQGKWSFVSSAERLDLPVTLRDSLSARLDRLGPARSIAQVAAVLGRTFTIGLLASVADAESNDLQRAVDQLVRSGLLLRKGIGARRQYLFKHVLIREAAYESLFAKERRRLHRRVAEALEGSLEVREQAPEQLAHHLTEAGDARRATEWWLLAGEKAISHSAHREGCIHLGHGLEEICKRAPGKERDRHELAFLIQLGAASSVLRGYAAPEVERTWNRAQDLCQNLTTSPQLFWVVWGVWSYHVVRAELTKAVDLAGWLLGMAEGLGSFELRLVANQTLGLVHYFLGDMETARTYLDTAIELDDPQRDHAISSASGQDAGVVVLATRALVHWHLDEAEAGERSIAAAIALAERLEHTYSIAFANVYAARFYQSCGNLEMVGEHAHTVVDLSLERGYFWLSQGHFFLGCRAAEMARRQRTEEGEGAEPCALLEEASNALRVGEESYQAAGARLSLTYMLAQVVEYHLLANEVGEGNARLNEAFEILSEGGERFWEADLLRLRGELLLLGNRREEARQVFLGALDLAQQRGHRAFELRIEKALARLR
jgi:serine/threonine protein kinase/tetratricopeptide (TPR) repeat protein